MLTITDTSTIERIPYKEFNVKQINSIKYLYKEFRQLSKMPTFALFISAFG